MTSCAELRPKDVYCRANFPPERARAAMEGTKLTICFALHWKCREDIRVMNDDDQNSEE